MQNLIISLCALAAMAATGISYQIGGERQWYKKPWLLAFKGSTTAFGGLLALYAYVQTGQPHALVMALGIFVCALADVLLEIRFLAGMACFALGHVAYMVSFWMRRPPQLPSLVLLVVLVLFVVAMVLRLRKKVAFSILPHGLYALLISGMAALALGQSAIVFIGALLFVISDAIIARRLVFPEKDPWDRACILLYYSAQFILAASLLL